MCAKLHETIHKTVWCACNNGVCLAGFCFVCLSYAVFVLVVQVAAVVWRWRRDLKLRSRTGTRSLSSVCCLTHLIDVVCVVQRGAWLLHGAPRTVHTWMFATAVFRPVRLLCRGADLPLKPLKKAANPTAVGNGEIMLGRSNVRRRRSTLAVALASCSRFCTETHVALRRS